LSEKKDQREEKKALWVSFLGEGNSQTSKEREKGQAGYWLEFLGFQKKESTRRPEVSMGGGL